MRFYVLNCLKGTSATQCLFEVWACGVVEAFDRARADGYWPLSVARSGWTETE